MLNAFPWDVLTRIALNADLFTSFFRDNALINALKILLWIPIHGHADNFNAQTTVNLV